MKRDEIVRSELSCSRRPLTGLASQLCVRRGSLQFLITFTKHSNSIGAKMKLHGVSESIRSTIFSLPSLPVLCVSHHVTAYFVYYQI